MSVLAPPPQDELELLIREARARQRRRWLGVAVLLALLSGAALGIDSIAGGSSPGRATSGGPGSAASSGRECGVRVTGAWIQGPSGKTVYRMPGNWTHPRRIPSEVKCSGSTVWVVWIAGAAMSQEAYVGARSDDGGNTWHLVFSEQYFGVKAPHQLGSYIGPWTLRSPRVAYFTGSCPACSVGQLSSTVFLWVTKDAGRTFREYPIHALTGYEPARMRVSGHEVTIFGKQLSAGVAPHKTATIRVG